MSADVRARAGKIRERRTGWPRAREWIRIVAAVTLVVEDEREDVHCWAVGEYSSAACGWTLADAMKVTWTRQNDVVPEQQAA
jgi:hypothetical protein